jgi:hypothetical protein
MLTGTVRNRKGTKQVRRDGLRTFLPEKKTRPPGHVKRSGCVFSQTPSMFLSAKLSTAIWMKQEKVVATTWHMNMVRGGIFM